MKKYVLHNNITILNAYVPNNRVLKYKKQRMTELKGEANKSITQVWDFNILFPLIDRSTQYS